MTRILGFFQRHSWSFVVLLALILLVINLLVSPSFLAPDRLPATLATLAPFVLVGFASTPSILSGGIDISVGPLATFINCLFVAVLLPSGLGDWYAAIPILLIAAGAIGTVTGLLVTVGRLHPVVASTGVLFILIGLSTTISRAPVSAPANWSDGLAQSYGWLPGAAITMGVVALAWFLAETTGGAATPWQGAVAGFAAAVLVSAAQVQLFQAEGKSWKILLLHVGYFIIALKIAGIVIALFQ